MNKKYLLIILICIGIILPFSKGVFAALPPQTFVFPDTVQMINNGTNWIAYCSDQATADNFCKLKGYDSALSFTSNYIGPTLWNDLVYKWIDGSFQQVGGNGCAHVIDNGVTCIKGSALCIDHSLKQCFGSGVYWYNSCGTKQDLFQQCATNQTCQNAQCIDNNITCSTNSQCGTNAYTGSPFCQGNNSYQNYITYTCNNAGTSNSYCSNSTAAQLKTTCTGGQTCNNGSCADQTVICSSNSQCGTNWLTGSPFCQGNSIYQSFITYTCNNAGTANSYCSNSTATQLVNNCIGSQTCNNGSCTGQNVTCSSNSQCGANGYTGSTFCQGNNVYQNYITYTCNNAGASNSYCTNSTSAQLTTNCSGNQTCNNGSCTQHQYPCYSSQCQQQQPCHSSQCQQPCNYISGYTGQSCQNSYQYQYQPYQHTTASYISNPVIYPPVNYSNLTILKQGRNLSDGISTFSDVVVADPNETVVFQIRVTNSGSNLLTSVLLKDILPSRVSFNWNITVDGNPIVGGDGGLLGSGLNLGDLSAGQSKIVSFQVKVSDVSQFSYGQVQLINTSTATSNNGATASDSAAICVTRKQVSSVSYGNLASYISTGITNNIFIDAVLIPLILSLFIVLVFKSKILKINQWIARKKSGNNGPETGKLLGLKISEIRQKEFGLDS